MNGFRRMKSNANAFNLGMICDRKDRYVVGSLTHFEYSGTYEYNSSDAVKIAAMDVRFQQ